MNDPLDSDSDFAEADETLKVCEESRRKLAAELDKTLAALGKARSDFAALRARCAAAEAEKVKNLPLDQERVRLLAEVNRAMENAEAVRREGIEALEEARELRRKKGP